MSLWDWCKRLSPSYVDPRDYYDQRQAAIRADMADANRENASEKFHRLEEEVRANEINRRNMTVQPPIVQPPENDPHYNDMEVAAKLAYFPTTESSGVFQGVFNTETGESRNLTAYELGVQAGANLRDQTFTFEGDGSWLSGASEALVHIDQNGGAFVGEQPVVIDNQGRVTLPTSQARSPLSNHSEQLRLLQQMVNETNQHQSALAVLDKPSKPVIILSEEKQPRLLEI